YDAEHGILPPAAIPSPDRRPLLSWRVAMLPYFDLDGVYKQFHLDEPWDSPHNLRLLPKMPSIYLNPRWQNAADAQQGLTYYQAIGGQNPLMGQKEPVGLGWLSNLKMTANQILIVEAATAVPWTKPEDLAYAPDQPLPKFGGPNQESFVAVFADNHVEV